MKYLELSKKEEYIEQYFDSIKYYLQKQLPICRSVLTKSECNYTDHKIVIQLEFGGSELLMKHKCDKRIETLISSEFGESVEVEFVDRHELTGNKHEYFEFKEKQESEIINKVLSQEIQQQAHKTKNISQSNGHQRGSAVILGKTIKGESIDFSELSQESGRVVVEGDIFSLETREIKGDRFIISFDITNYKNSTTIKLFCDKDKFPTIENRLIKGIRVKVRGDVRYDKYARELVIFAYDIMQVQKKEREDKLEEKRVELHLHTQMSAMDGVSSTNDLITRAASWGHKAIAITDHGVVQAFPDAYSAGKKNNIKIIYGVECYLVNDSVPIVYHPMDIPLDGDFVVFDIETTGLNAQRDKITEIGAVKISKGEIVDRFNTFINPEVPIPSKIIELTGITNDMVKDAPTVNEVMGDFLQFCNGCALVAHNAQFDTGFIKVNARNLDLDFDFCVLDTLELSRDCFLNLNAIN